MSVNAALLGTAPLGLWPIVPPTSGAAAPKNVWVSPACEIAVKWGPLSDPSLRGRLESGFVTVLATFSVASVTVPVQDGVAVVPPMQWPVDDDGLVESALTFKIGLKGCSPNPIGGVCTMSEQVRALAKPMVYFANPMWTVAELSQNGRLAQDVGSLENPGVAFSVELRTEYAHSPQQSMVVEALCEGERKSLATVAAELSALSSSRRECIAAFVQERFGADAAERCVQWMVQCPEHSWSQMQMMDPAQMHEFSDSLSENNRQAYLLTLCSALQQCLVELGRDQGVRDGAVAGVAEVHAGCATPTQRALLVQRMVCATTRSLTCNSTYTFDAGVEGFVFKAQGKKMVAIARGASEVRVLSGYMTKNGESQDLAGLPDVGSLRLRENLMQSARASLAAYEGQVPDADLKHALNQTYVEQNAERKSGDCEDLAFACRCAVRSVLHYGGEPYAENEELCQAMALALDTLLPDEQETHAALVALAHAFRAGMYEATQSHGDKTCELGVGLVYARGSHISAQTRGGAVHNTLPHDAEAVHAQMRSELPALAGHAVCMWLETADTTKHGDVEVARIVGWHPHEGTADVRVAEGIGSDTRRVQLEDTERSTMGRYDMYNNVELNGCDAHNVMTNFAADSSTSTAGRRAPERSVASRLSFNASQVSDPACDASTFYRYAMACGRFYVLTCDGGKTGLLQGGADARVVGTQTGAWLCREAGGRHVVPCANLVLSKANTDAPHKEMIGVTTNMGDEERRLLKMAAGATRGLYPCLGRLCVSARQTHFRLMPTASMRPPLDGTKINCFQPAAPLGFGCAVELAERETVRASLRALQVSNLNSHVASYEWHGA